MSGANAVSKVRKSQQEIRISDSIFLDTARRKLLKHGETVPLKAMEYKMLHYLVVHRGNVITKDEFLKNVWEDEFIGEGTLAVHIRHLREKIETDCNAPSLIRTVWGVGYLMEAEDKAVGYRLREGCLEMSVRDYGVGVPETEIGLVTTKYYRGKNADGKDGSGLGLYIADLLMEKMNGELICSCKSEGFQVTLLIPLS